MEDSVNGLHGVHAQQHVMRVRSLEHDHVQIQFLNMVGQHAQDIQMNISHVLRLIVRVGTL